MSVIRILPESVANKIAAGEVVERPASVVKEALENSLDAGALRMDLYIEGGGKRLIRVEDDGCGMARDDALLAFERHATSKIKDAEDLLEIATLGFRGEALPSMASVSRLLLETRRTSESDGTQIEMAGGKLLNVREIARPGGTRIEVRDLFFNVPARRKFLKSESTELGHIASLVTHYALAHPEKFFRLASFTHEILNATPVPTLRERFYQVMGSQMLEQMVEVAPVERVVPTHPEPEEEGESEIAKVRIFGFVSRPEVQKLNRNQIYFFVNRRLVRDRLILHAVTEAYRNILPSGMFPVALIFLEMSPAEVDVNVHPAKTEVRFRHSAFVHDFARDTLRGALIASRPIAVFPQPHLAKLQASTRFSEIEGAVRPDEEVTGAFLGLSVAPAPSGPLPHFALAPPRPQPETGVLPLGTLPQNVTALPRPGDLAASETSEAVPPDGEACAPTAGGAASEVALHATGSLDEFPKDLRPFGQVHESFIIATNSEGLWIIDQHVAHERILFEHRLRKQREMQAEGQRLLMPVIVELQPQQQAVFADLSQELAANGFEAEAFGQRTIAIKTAPAEIRAAEAERLLLEILDGAGLEMHQLSLDVVRHKIAASIACHAAIKVNMPLDVAKMEWLLRELEKTACPMTCPHGRPVLLRYSLRDIQKAFRRI
ncbi:MAG: DNA mismatch repair endonuclease MutL [Terriglobia bacterium]